MLSILTRLSALHPTAASRAADVLRVIRTAPSALAERVGDALFAAEQALREHDQVHQARVRRADQAVDAIVRDMRRAAAEAEAKRWNGAN
jgi:phosphate uptake regulator